MWVLRSGRDWFPETLPLDHSGIELEDLEFQSPPIRGSRWRSEVKTAARRLSELSGRAAVSRKVRASVSFSPRRGGLRSLLVVASMIGFRGLWSSP